MLNDLNWLSQSYTLPLNKKYKYNVLKTKSSLSQFDSNKQIAFGTQLPSKHTAFILVPILLGRVTVNTNIVSFSSFPEVCVSVLLI